MIYSACVENFNANNVCLLLYLYHFFDVLRSAPSRLWILRFSAKKQGPPSTSHCPHSWFTRVPEKLIPVPGCTVTRTNRFR